ncbi:MAG: bifunctional aspartate kinase/homoserine dehydrogenase I, partial [Acidobacteria bacterium]
TLISPARRQKVLKTLQTKLKELADILQGIFLIKELTLRTLDVVMSFGELLSAYIISEAMRVRFLDARMLIKTDQNFGSAHVLTEITYKNIRNYFSNESRLNIITGFIGCTEQNETTTLGRGGSDYSASIFGAALDVSEIEIWTDVDGVMTADPRKVKDAFPISEMSYEEAMEMSHFGAKIIHPPTMQPALKQEIPIRIKNTFHSDFSGTLISKKSKAGDFVIRGISSIHDVTLLRIQGSGMVGVPGISSRLFGALASGNISVILITQASSEHSICIAIEPKLAEEACKRIESEFSLEIHAELIDHVIVETEHAIIAVVGENMRSTPGISGQLFQALGQSRINVIAVAQGSSELNISIVVRKQDEPAAIHAIHQKFFHPDRKTVHVFVVGTGLVGGALLKQIASLPQSELRIAAIANSRKMIWDVKPNFLLQLEDQGGERTDIEVFLNRVKASKLQHRVLVDCTSNEWIAERYVDLLDSGVAIATPNKKAFSADLNSYKKLRLSRVPIFFEATVGAGLPVISTLQDLIRSGDTVLKIEAVLSGTLNYIFSSLDSGEKKFSAVVQEAMAKGYTEPDPRDDLSGMDVRRKILILAREAGHPLELKDVSVQNLLSREFFQIALKEFLKRLPELDDQFSREIERVMKQQRRLRYIAQLDRNMASVSLKAVDSLHPFYSLSGSDNMIAFTTKRYQSSALVVRGPGAGAEVTAGAVLADLIRMAGLTW